MNKTFVYNPEKIKNWGKEITEVMAGGGNETIIRCYNDFKKQIEALVSEGVWTGPAAHTNFDDMKNTLMAIVNFSNDFGEALTTAMGDLYKKVKDLEASNADTGGLSFDADLPKIDMTIGKISVNEAAFKKVNEVVYNPVQIDGIHNQLLSIREQFSAAQQKLIGKINKLDSGEGIWDGGAAENYKMILNDYIKPNSTEGNTASMSKIFANLDTCISNVKTALDKAMAANR